MSSTVETRRRAARVTRRRTRTVQTLRSAATAGRGDGFGTGFSVATRYVRRQLVDTCRAPISVRQDHKDVAVTFQQWNHITSFRLRNDPISSTTKPTFKLSAKIVISRWAVAEGGFEAMHAHGVIADANGHCVLLTFATDRSGKFKIAFHKASTPFTGSVAQKVQNGR